MEDTASASTQSSTQPSQSFTQPSTSTQSTLVEEFDKNIEAYCEKTANKMWEEAKVHILNRSLAGETSVGIYYPIDNECVPPQKSDIVSKLKVIYSKKLTDKLATISKPDGFTFRSYRVSSWLFDVCTGHKLTFEKISDSSTNDTAKSSATA